MLDVALTGLVPVLRYFAGRQSLLVPITIDTVEEDKSVSKPEVLLGTTAFWKYRQIPKGPQGLTFEPQVAAPPDPTQPLEFRDPAFVETPTTAKLTHFGKARTGEGNDITPNPEKLAKLGHTIKDIRKKLAAVKGDRDNKDKVKLDSRLACL